MNKIISLILSMCAGIASCADQKQLSPSNKDRRPAPLQIERPAPPTPLSRQSSFTIINISDGHTPTASGGSSPKTAQSQSSSPRARRGSSPMSPEHPLAESIAQLILVSPRAYVPGEPAGHFPVTPPAPPIAPLPLSPIPHDGRNSPPIPPVPSEPVPVHIQLHPLPPLNNLGQSLNSPSSSEDEEMASPAPVPEGQRSFFPEGVARHNDMQVMATAAMQHPLRRAQDRASCWGLFDICSSRPKDGKRS